MTKTENRSVVSPVLTIENYSLDYETANGPYHALKNIGIAINRGEILGLVGESGSGKTSLAWSIMRYLPKNAREPGGKILLDGENLLEKSEREMETFRGRRISMTSGSKSRKIIPRNRKRSTNATIVACRWTVPKTAA